MAILGLGILAFVYTSARIWESMQPKKQNIKILSGKQPKENLQLSTISIGLSLFRNMHPVITIINFSILIYLMLPILKGAEKEIFQKKQINSATIYALVNLFFISQKAYFLTALSSLMYYFDQFIDYKTKSYAQNINLGILQQKLPDYVWLLKQDSEIQVNLKDLQIGDIILIKAGDILVVDGVIETGEALINQQVLTGEIDAINKKTNDSVFAGCKIESGSITVKVQAFGEKTMFAKINKNKNFTVKQAGDEVIIAFKLART